MSVHLDCERRDEQNLEQSGFIARKRERAPVLDWLRGLDKDDRHAIGLDLMRVQFGWPIGRPMLRVVAQPQ